MLSSKVSSTITMESKLKWPAAGFSDPVSDWPVPQSPLFCCSDPLSASWAGVIHFCLKAWPLAVTFLGPISLLSLEVQLFSLLGLFKLQFFWRHFLRCLVKVPTEKLTFLIPCSISCIEMTTFRDAIYLLKGLLSVSPQWNESSMEVEIFIISTGTC